MKRTPSPSQPAYGSTSSSPRPFRCVSENLGTFPSSPHLFSAHLLVPSEDNSIHVPPAPPHPVRPELKLCILPLPQGPARVLETWPGSRQGCRFQGREDAPLSTAGRSVGLPDALSLQTPRLSLPGTALGLDSVQTLAPSPASSHRGLCGDTLAHVLLCGDVHKWKAQFLVPGRAW